MKNEYNSYFFNEFHQEKGTGNYMDAELWVPYFQKVARKIVDLFNPTTVLDAGCACGYLVAALRDLGIEAYGFDISKYAISNVREDVREFCFEHNITEPLPSQVPQHYDLIVTTEVLEHLFPRDGERALANLCEYTDTIIFSSTPSDIDDRTHVNVQLPEYWAEMFYNNSFAKNFIFDMADVSPWCVIYERFSDLKKLIFNYELNMRIDRAVNEKNLNQTINDLMESLLNVNSRVYFDQGEGFTEENSVEVPQKLDEAQMLINVAIPENTVALRFHPLEDQYCMLKNIEIYLDNLQTTEFTTNGEIVNHYILFNDLDPYILIEGIKGRKQLKLQAKFQHVEEEYLQLYNSKIATIDEDNPDFQAKVKVFEDEITELKTSLEELNTSLGEKEKQIKDNSLIVAEKDSAIAERNAAIAEKNSIIAEKNAVIAEQEATIASAPKEAPKPKAAPAPSNTVELERNAALAQRDAALAEKDKIKEEKDGVIAEKESIIAEKEGIIAEKDAEIESLSEKGTKFDELEAIIAEKEKELAELKEKLAESDKTIGEKDSSLVRKDLELTEKAKDLSEKEATLEEKEDVLSQMDEELYQKNTKISDFKKSMEIAEEDNALLASEKQTIADQLDAFQEAYEALKDSNKWKAVASFFAEIEGEEDGKGKKGKKEVKGKKEKESKGKKEKEPKGKKEKEPKGKKEKESKGKKEKDAKGKKDKDAKGKKEKDPKGKKDAKGKKEKESKGKKDKKGDSKFLKKKQVDEDDFDELEDDIIEEGDSILTDDELEANFEAAAARRKDLDDDDDDLDEEDDLHDEDDEDDEDDIDEEEEKETKTSPSKDEDEDDDEEEED